MALVLRLQRLDSFIIIMFRGTSVEFVKNIFCNVIVLRGTSVEFAKNRFLAVIVLCGTVVAYSFQVLSYVAV